MVNNLVIHRGNRTEVVLEDDSVVLKRLLDFANVEEERRALSHEQVMQTLAQGWGVVPLVGAPPSAPVDHFRRHYIQGLTLGEFLNDSKAEPCSIVPPAESLIAALCDILTRVHATHDQQGDLLQLTHRDITPGNVLVDTTGNVWLNDFGLAHCCARARLTDEQTLQGTPRYLCPEALRGEQVSSKSDVYQAGLLYCLLAAKRAGVKLELSLDPKERQKQVRPYLEPIGAIALASNSPDRRPSAAQFALLLRKQEQVGSRR